MKTIILAGMKKRGKSTRAKKYALAARKPLFVYDVNNEWNVGYKPLKMEDFLSAATEKTNTCVVFEEATIFFGTRTSNIEMRELLVRNRHTNNTYILIFHSLSDCPSYIFRMADYLCLFKTNDSLTDIQRKFAGMENVIEAFHRVKENSNTDFHYFEEILLN